jgi:polysaccharide export outer membrane protein
MVRLSIKKTGQILRHLRVAAILVCVTFGAAVAQDAHVPEPVVPWMAAQGLSGVGGGSEAYGLHAFEPARGNGVSREMPLYGQNSMDDVRFAPSYPQAMGAAYQQPYPLAYHVQEDDEPELSPLEDVYSSRVDEDLTQFGYDIFGVAVSPANARSGAVRDEFDWRRHELNGMERNGRIADYSRQEIPAERPRYGLPAGAVQDHFILNIGDRLDIVFSGQRQDRDIYIVNNQGLLLVDNMPPIPAAGRSIDAVRQSLQAYAGRLHNTHVFVSLETVGQIDVLVTGHVNRPGRQTLTVFHTVLDALTNAGGVQKAGSLRHITLLRRGEKRAVDLYDLLMEDGGSGHQRDIDLMLRDGDRLIVPPVGKTVAVSGNVKRPGIYELVETRGNKASMMQLLGFAGGVLKAGHNRFIKLGLTLDGRETVDEVKDKKAAQFGDGAILMVAAGQEKRAHTVTLAGHTRRAGLHALDQAETLGALLDSDKVLGKDIYPLIGVIARRNKEQLSTQWLPFPLIQVLKGTFDRALKDGDVVHLFSRAQIMALQDKEGMDAMQAEKARMIPAAMKEKGGKDKDEEERLTDPVLISLLKEHSVFVRGAIRQQGAWPIVRGITLDNILSVAGGLTREANTRNIEVTSALLGEDGQAHGRSGTLRLKVDLQKTEAADVELAPGDTVRVNQRKEKVKDKSVMIVGEVNNPGTYDLMPGDKMSDLLRRAGGVTLQAYPKGAIFSRESARRAEEQRFRSAARDLEQAIALSLQGGKEAPGPKQIAIAKGLAAELRQVEAVGRITVEADPAVLVMEEELDILLEPGDKIYIPKRPLSVRVSGEVLSPASLQFRKDKDAPDYIGEAGGYTYHADKDRVFVLYPDGSAQPLRVNYWNHNPAFIPPGATIVVPRDPKPFNFIESAKDISQILSNLAITGIFLDDIRE